MPRWWNIRDRTQNGLTLNRVWHVRQFLFALIPGALLLTMVYSARWAFRDEIKQLEERAASQRVSPMTQRRNERLEKQTLEERIRQLEAKLSELEQQKQPTAANSHSSTSISSDSSQAK